ncbi:redoxin domain-containing protein [Chryseosolibacter indicus]|uniref:Redoxin domain-containing protein n=1 Tax=Chryseosolibacter indicus TaxID=2782351 RepID=A0ABS5VRB0_9BACT|nr:redoxin domain-containing protein [Chryseosolibacter indicus]MBT1703881.1 redoxin domain-containing protein [Chryseosolibacter indicus]
MKKLVAVLFTFIAVIAARGQQVSNFSLTNVINNQTVSLDTYPSCQGLVIVFTSTNCPYDEYYRNRIAKLAQNYQDRVPVLLVNSDPNGSNESMAAKAKQQNTNIPYLSDKDQTLMTNLNARKSPEAFLLKNNNGKFSVVYRGAIDDNAQVEGDVRQHYLKDAIDIMLSNQTITTPEVRPVGCNLKKKG